jgi:hypothetical protein
MQNMKNYFSITNMDVKVSLMIYILYETRKLLDALVNVNIPKRTCKSKVKLSP